MACEVVILSEIGGGSGGRTSKWRGEKSYPRQRNLLKLKSLMPVGGGSGGRNGKNAFPYKEKSFSLLFSLPRKKERETRALYKTHSYNPRYHRKTNKNNIKINNINKLDRRVYKCPTPAKSASNPRYPRYRFRVSKTSRDPISRDPRYPGIPKVRTLRKENEECR